MEKTKLLWIVLISIAQILIHGLCYTQEAGLSETIKGLPEGTLSKHYYVSKKTGKGKVGSRLQPAAELGAIVPQLKSGDVVHIAEGVYEGINKSGSVEVNVPVTIIGGYDVGFVSRDPWGQHKTVFSGVNHIRASTQPGLYVNLSKGNLPGESRAQVVVDGIIFDNGSRNRYRESAEHIIVRQANPATHKNASPASPGLKVIVRSNTDVVIKNCIVMNTAPSEGALTVQAGQHTEVLIRNNLIVNNTGEGIYAMSNWHSSEPEGLPRFHLKENTVLYTWRYDLFSSTFSGSAVKVDTDITLVAENNVFGFSDTGGFDNSKKCERLQLSNNLFLDNNYYDYKEYNAEMPITSIADNALYLGEESRGNFNTDTALPVAKRWRSLYAKHTRTSRAKLEEGVEADRESFWNRLASFFNRNIRGKDIQVKYEVWLPRMALSEATVLGENRYLGRYGCKKP